MDSVRRFLASNSLFLLTLAASLAGHASLGWFGSPSTEGPRLDQVESGHTSVAVQWIAQPPPVSLADFEPIEPEPIDRYEPVPTSDASPSEIELARDGQRDAVPFESSIEGVEPPSVTQPPQPQPPALAAANQFVHALPSPPSDERMVPRRPTKPAVRLEDSTIDIPETVVSLESSGAEVPPAFVTRPLPDYPEELLLRRIEGVVRLLVTIRRDGRVASAKVYSSSGYAEMDESALRTVQTWVFSPARRGGIPIEETVVVPIRFRIRPGD
ncbi:MAG: TonB family protein [Pirellulaceae bacterium]|nr:TonB family protein [Pirellulaceae bacterium]